MPSGMCAKPSLVDGTAAFDSGDGVGAEVVVAVGDVRVRCWAPDGSNDAGLAGPRFAVI